MKHHSVKYLNNIVESDYGNLKRLMKPTLGFKSMKTAYDTLFEIMRMFKKGQLSTGMNEKNVMEEVRFINQTFGIYTR